MNRLSCPIWIILFVTFSIVGCKTAEYNVRWLGNPIILDAYYSDWQGSLTSIQEGKISYGFQQDSSSFYICLIATNTQVQRQILMQGLEIHLDPDGDKRQRLSIKYPLGLMASGMPFRDMANPMTHPGTEPPDMLYRFQNSLGELEIKTVVDEAYNRFALAELPALGLGLRSSAETGEWICEMRIPLGSVENFKYALGQSDVASVAIEMETPELNRDAMHEPMSGMAEA